MSERPASNPQEKEGRDDMSQYLDRSSNLFAEDELVNWFQYRLDDSFEKDYCSDIFRQWPSPAITATTSYGMQGACHGVTLEGGQDTSSIVGGSQLIGTAAKSSSKVEGAVVSLTKTNSADAALAMGAGRAAGIISQTGAESFSKVRTSLQPPAPKLDLPALGVTKTCVSPFPALAPQNLLQKLPTFPSGYSILPPRSRALASYGNILPFQQGHKFGKPSNSSELSRPATIFASENFVNKQRLGTPAVGGSSSSDHTDHSLPESSTTALEAARMQNANASVYRSKEVDTSEIAVRAEQTAAKSSSNAVDSATDRTWSDSLERSRMSGVSLPLFEKKMDGLDMHSGGSQTSESLKDSKLSVKRKLEDSECQSANAEGESAEIKSYQARTSTSKRSRAAETHNLSERRRRDRINEKMKALQELIPNSNKTDKASVLDEAIEYLKMLQLQLQMMSIRSGVSLSPAVLPNGLPHMQIPQLGQLHPLGMGMNGGVSGTGAEMGPSVTLGMGIVGGPSGTGAEAGRVMSMDFRMGMPTGASGTGEGMAQHIGLGTGLTGGVSGASAGNGGLGMADMTFTAPAKPLGSSPSLSAPINHVLRPSSVPTVYTSSSHPQASITTESLPVYFPHSQFQDPSQSIRLVNMDMYNTYLQQQQQLQQLQHQQLQQLNHNHHHKQQQQSGSHSQK